MDIQKGKIRLSDKAYMLIRELIISMQLRPGEKVDEGDLEQRLSIGRTPIREALQRLAVDGLLDQMAGRGLIVRSVSIDDVKSLFEAMTALEQVLVQLAVQRIRPEEITKLEEISKKHKEAQERKEYLQVTYLNIAFHRSYYEASGNHFLVTAMEKISSQSERLAYLCYTKESNPNDYNELAVDDHKRLIECFKSGNSEQATTIITDHYRRFFLRVCHYMEPRASLIVPQVSNGLLDIIATEDKDR